MRLIRRYIWLQRLCYVQSAFVLFVAVLSLFLRRRPNVVNVTHVTEKLDLPALSALTNSPSFIRHGVPPAVSSFPVSFDSSPSSSYVPELSFDGYFVPAGVPMVVYDGQYFREGDLFDGLVIERISPVSVVLGGHRLPVNRGWREKQWRTAQSTSVSSTATSRPSQTTRVQSPLASDSFAE